MATSSRPMPAKAPSDSKPNSGLGIREFLKIVGSVHTSVSATRGIHGPNLLPNAIATSKAGGTGAEEKGAVLIRCDRERNEHLGKRRLLRSVVVNIADDANDFEVSIVRRSATIWSNAFTLNLLADRISIPEILVSKCLTDDRVIPPDSTSSSESHLPWCRRKPSVLERFSPQPSTPASSQHVRSGHGHFGPATNHTPAA